MTLTLSLSYFPPIYPLDGVRRLYTRRSIPRPLIHLSFVNGKQRWCLQDTRLLLERIISYIAYIVYILYTIRPEASQIADHGVYPCSIPTLCVCTHTHTHTSFICILCIKARVYTCTYIPNNFANLILFCLIVIFYLLYINSNNFFKSLCI